MRQLFTKRQWFILVNCAAIVIIYLTGDLHFKATDIISLLLALALVNGAALISANRYQDWKK